MATLDHNQLAELYAVRTELEGLAARLAARHATDEEIRVLRLMAEEDRALTGGDPRALSRANKRFHKQIHLASHNRFLVQQLDLVHRSMALMANTSFAAEGRDDDTPEVVRNRLDKYTSQTAPVIDYYRQHGQLTVVDGVGSLDDVFNRLIEALSPAKEVG